MINEVNLIIPTAAQVAARRQAAHRCVDMFGQLIAEEADLDAAAEVVERAFFDGGWTETEVMTIFRNVARSIRENPANWALNPGEPLPDVEWVSQVYFEFTDGVCECDCCWRAWKKKKVDPTSELIRVTARRTANRCAPAFPDAVTPAAIAAIARQLARGWSSSQLVRAAMHRLTCGGALDIAAVEFFGKTFDSLCPGRDFIEGSCSVVTREPWYPNEPIFR